VLSDVSNSAPTQTDVLAFSGFPCDHWRRIWSNTALERVNKEVKRRTKVVQIFVATLPSSAWSLPSSPSNTHEPVNGHDPVRERWPGDCPDENASATQREQNECDGDAE
jgi:hypothetical protein